MNKLSYVKKTLHFGIINDSVAYYCNGNCDDCPHYVMTKHGWDCKLGNL